MINKKKLRNGLTHINRFIFSSSIFCLKVITAIAIYKAYITLQI